MTLELEKSDTVKIILRGQGAKILKNQCLSEQNKTNKVG